nr:MAG TPA: hypothetical protein [Caudoviricetes sp.]
MKRHTKGAFPSFNSYAGIIRIRSEGFISARNFGHPLIYAL